ncbi:hypothetical protein ACFLS1_05090 [Verrucomicrobiota bacterium]
MKSTDTEIKETDIVFDCPICGKSLAIDYKGAGLTIPCTDCGKNVQVPIPDGMEIDDIDGTEEVKEMRMVTLRKSLSQAKAKISELEDEIEELNIRRDSLEKKRTDNMYRFAEIIEKVGVIQKALKEVTKDLNAISDTAQATK